MKPSILVPVDFTDNAFNAYNYANNLAYFLDCKLHLLHVVINDSLKPLSPEQVSIKLKSFASWHPNETGNKFFPIETTYEILTGDVANQVVSRSQDEGFSFIVCATRDDHTLRDKWLGTISSEIALAADIPVILVPKSARFASLDTIVVGCDEHTGDERVLAQLAKMSDWFESEIHFVHVSENEDAKFVAIEKDIFGTITALQKKVLKVKMSSLNAIDIVNALFTYSTRNQADLLVMISEKRNFLKRLLFQSMSRKASLETSVPTMIMHL
ncbi:MAG: universal stress protein [Saprospiraceae bacterium]|nr:universal stress protein [Saprospiraceae bacterium]